MKVFINWINYYLLERNIKIKDLTIDLCDGLILIHLIEILRLLIIYFKTYFFSKKTIEKNYHIETIHNIHKIQNINICMKFLREKFEDFPNIPTESKFII